jgi:hypothetical protein
MKMLRPRGLGGRLDETGKLSAVGPSPLTKVLTLALKAACRLLDLGAVAQIDVASFLGQSGDGVSDAACCR